MMDRRPITGATRLAAVIGDPVRHSLSPTIHNAGFDALDLDWRYVALEVADGGGARAVGAMRTLGLGGLSVTMPHKDAVAAASDRTTAAVDALGAANTVFWSDGRLVADNTDGDGFVAALAAETGVDFGGLHVVVLGAGGAARAIIDALGRAGADRISVLNRSPERGALAAAVHPCAHLAERSVVRRADVVVNATSVGMGARPDDHSQAVLPIDPDLLVADQLVADIVYQPLETPLLAAAASVGCTTVGGVGMLLHQAVLQFERWTGTEAPIAPMRAALLAAIASRPAP